MRRSSAAACSSSAGLWALILAGAALTAAGWGLGAGKAWAQRALPSVARVVDETGTLTSEQRSALERILAEFERRKGSQVAVVVIPTTEPESIEEFAIRLAEAWKLGRKGVDDGVIVILAKQDKRVRIEVGYGLEGVLPDAVTKRIIAEIMTPEFRKNAYGAGIQAGVERMLRIVDGEPLPAPKRSKGTASPLDGAIGLGVTGILVGWFLNWLHREAPRKRKIWSGIAAGCLGLIGAAQSGVLAAIAGVGGVLLVLGLRAKGVDINAVGMTLLAVGIGGRRRGGGGGFGGGGGGFGGGGASGSW